MFNGPDPEVRVFDNCSQEIEAIGLWVYEAIDEGIEPDEMGIFVRSANELSRARAVVKQAGHTPLELLDRVEERAGRISIGTMHLAKGLEFRGRRGHGLRRWHSAAAKNASKPSLMRASSTKCMRQSVISSMSLAPVQEIGS